MATLNIKDPRVHALAHELAQFQGSSLTSAVRGALEEAVLRARGDRTDRAEQLRRLQARVAANAGRWPTDDELYDDAGLPR